MSNRIIAIALSACLFLGGLIGFALTLSDEVDAQGALVVQDVGGLRCAFFPPAGPPSCVHLGGPLPPVATPTLIPPATPLPIPTATPITQLAQIISPLPGTPPLPATTTFTWTSGTGVAQKWLWVSTVPGDGNLYSQDQGSATSVTVAGLPPNQRLYVRLWSFGGGGWQFIDYQYGPGAVN